MERSSSNKRNQVRFRNAIASSNSEAANLPAAEKLPSGFRADLKNLAHFVQIEDIGIWECEVNKHFEETMARLVKEIQNAQE